MKLVEAHAQLLNLGHNVFQTRDVAAYLEISIAHASKILNRLLRAGHIIKIRWGIWALVGIDPLQVPEYLTSPFPSYLSLQTALYYHNMISQIPDVYYVVSLARTKIYQNQLGSFSVHHIDPHFFFGYECSDKSGIKMATAEKALLDYLYLSPGKTGRFSKLPELELPKNFSIKIARSYIKKIPSKARRTMVLERFNELLG